MLTDTKIYQLLLQTIINITIIAALQEFQHNNYDIEIHRKLSQNCKCNSQYVFVFKQSNVNTIQRKCNIDRPSQS